LLFLGRDFDGKVVQLLAINQSDAQLLLLSCIDEHSLHLNWTLDFGPTQNDRRISSRTAMRSTARRGGACREAKNGCGAACESRSYLARCGPGCQNLFGLLHRRRAGCVFWIAIRALRFEWAFERWPRYRGPTNMRRVRFVLWLRSRAPRHCVVTHRMFTGDDDGANHSPRP